MPTVLKFIDTHMRKLICIFFLFFTINSFAQDSSSIRQGDIYQKGPAWRMNGKKLKAKELKQEIYKVPAAIPYYKKAQTNFNLSIVALAATGTFLLFSKEKDSGSPNFGKRKTGFLIAGLVSGGISAHLAFRGKKNMRIAVKLRNTAY